MSQDKTDKTRRWYEPIAQAIASLEFGEIKVTVHDSRVVKVERVEKLRLEAKEIRDSAEPQERTT